MRLGCLPVQPERGFCSGGASKQQIRSMTCHCEHPAGRDAGEHRNSILFPVTLQQHLLTSSPVKNTFDSVFTCNKVRQERADFASDRFLKLFSAGGPTTRIHTLRLPPAPPALSPASALPNAPPRRCHFFSPAVKACFLCAWCTTLIFFHALRSHGNTISNIGPADEPGLSRRLVSRHRSFCRRFPASAVLVRRRLISRVCSDFGA